MARVKKARQVKLDSKNRAMRDDAGNVIWIGGEVIEIPDEEIWGPRRTSQQIAQERREQMPPVNRTQFSIALFREGVINKKEARNFAAGRALPAFVETALDALPNGEAIEAEIKILAATSFNRTQPLVVMMQRAAGLTPKQADTVFEIAATVT